MNRVRTLLTRIKNDESGHAMVGFPSLIAAAGAIALGMGAADGTDWLTIGGGIVLGLGIFLGGVARHRGIDYDVYTRLDKLEGK